MMIELCFLNLFLKFLFILLLKTFLFPKMECENASTLGNISSKANYMYNLS